MKMIRRKLIELAQNIKRTLTENRWITILLGLAFFIGVVWSFSSIREAASRYSDGNIITAIRAQDFNYLLTLLKILLFITLSYMILLFTPYHFFIFLASFLVQAIIVRFAFVLIFVSCLLDGITGYLLLLILWLPLLLLSYYCLLTSYNKIFCVSGFNFTKRKPVCSITVKKTVSIIIKSYLINIIGTFIFYTIIIILLTLIF